MAQYKVVNYVTPTVTLRSEGPVRLRRLIILLGAGSGSEATWTFYDGADTTAPYVVALSAGSGVQQVVYELGIDLAGGLTVALDVPTGTYPSALVVYS